jgi:hypothetical protein
MRLSRKSHRKLEFFFREYFNESDLKLPDVELFVKRGAGLITGLFKIYGITIGQYIFIRADFLYRNENQELCIAKELLAHELTHVLQYQKLGFFRFFYTYLKGYWLALKQKEKWDLAARNRAYLEIPHEIEARQCAAKFLEWMNNKGQLKIKSER